MNVKIKKLREDAVIPSYAKQGDAGLDLTNIGVSYNAENDYIEYYTGLAIEIPEGYVGLLFPRSSISNYTLHLANSVGVIDSGYRSEIKLRFKKTNEFGYRPYDVGKKVGQLIIIPIPTIQLVEVDELSQTERGLGGFGSSGK